MYSHPDLRAYQERAFAKAWAENRKRARRYYMVILPSVTAATLSACGLVAWFVRVVFF